MRAEVLNLELELLLCPVGRALSTHVSLMSSSPPIRLYRGLCTLKAKCSRKCAVPFVSAVSAREPASIHMPTVEVCA